MALYFTISKRRANGLFHHAPCRWHGREISKFWKLNKIKYLWCILVSFALSLTFFEFSILSKIVLIILFRKMPIILSVFTWMMPKSFWASYKYTDYSYKKFKFQLLNTNIHNHIHGDTNKCVHQLYTFKIWYIYILTTK